MKIDIYTHWWPRKAAQTLLTKAGNNQDHDTLAYLQWRESRTAVSPVTPTVPITAAAAKLTSALKHIASRVPRALREFSSQRRDGWCPGAGRTR